VEVVVGVPQQMLELMELQQMVVVLVQAVHQ